MHDLSLGLMDESHSSHIGSELVDLVDAATQRCNCRLRLAQVGDHEFMR